MKKLLSTILLLVLAASTATLSAQPVCKRAGNVEVAITPDQAQSNSYVKVTFTNYNSFQATVNATIVIANEKGATKEYPRTFVVPAKGENGKKTFRFDSADVGNCNILPRNCYIKEMYVEKCQGE